MYWQRSISRLIGALSQYPANTPAAISLCTRSPQAQKHSGAAAGLLTIALCMGTPAFAQDRSATIDREITTLAQQIATKQQQIQTLRNRPSAEQSELNAARTRLAEAQAALKAKPSPENESKAKNAEFKVKLAEIKYDKAHPDVGALVDDVEQLKSELAGKEREAKELRETPARQPVDNSAREQKKTAENQAKQRQQELELVRTRQEAEAQQKEIERLKAALAAKEAKESASTPPVAPAPKAVASPPAQPAAAAPSTAAPASASTTPQATASTGGGAMKLITAQEVAQELQQLQQRLAAPGPGRETNDALYLKRPNVAVTNKDKVILRALGREQYRGQAAVEAGKYQISVGFHQWPIEFGAGETGPTTFLYDHSDPQKPRLFIYNSTLEAGK